MTLTPRWLRYFRIQVLVCGLAPSNKNTTDSRQFGDSRSRIWIKCTKKMYKTSLSVVAWVSENQLWPSVSMAAKRESLGVTVLITVEQVSFLGAHILRMKVVPFNQLSSILITRIPFSRIGIMAIPYYWRITRHLSVFPYFATGTAFRQLIPNYYLRTDSVLDFPTSMSNCLFTPFCT